MAQHWKLLAYADDIFIMANNINEAKETIIALEKLKQCGLNINLKKTWIMSDRSDMEGV